jgi:hypothetical protein
LDVICPHQLARILKLRPVGRWNRCVKRKQGQVRGVNEKVDETTGCLAGPMLDPKDTPDRRMKNHLLAGRQGRCVCYRITETNQFSRYNKMLFPTSKLKALSWLLNGEVIPRMRLRLVFLHRLRHRVDVVKIMAIWRRAQTRIGSSSRREIFEKSLV